MRKDEEEDECVIEKRKVDLKVMEKGNVWIVGEGKGDKGILKINEVKDLKKEDVIVYEEMVDD